MIRFGKKTEKGIRTASMLVTVITLIWLTDFFSDSLISCLLLVWKHTVGRIDVPVLGSEGEREIRLIGWSGFCIAIMAVCGVRRRLASAFRGKSGKWCAVLTLPLLVVAVVTYVANWGAGYGILYRSDGNMGLYYDQIFSYVGWCVLSGLSLFAAGVYVFGMDRIYVEQKRAEQYRVQAAVYQTLEEQYTQAKRLRHDLKNHVLAMRGLWEDQAWEKLGEYLKRMENSAQLGMSEEATGNRAVDALLCQKRQLAEEKSIAWECDVRIPKRCHTNEFDLCILFGNILDNAVEACERLQRQEYEPGLQPFISVQAGAVKSCFLLEVRNSMNESEKQKGKNTEKGNTQAHGIGLLNVSDVVRKYNGLMKTEIRNGVYDISVLLPLAETAYDMEQVV